MSCLHEPERLLGRSAEESILLNSYFASLSMSKQSPAAVILIHGDSGLGKTKLAETIKPHVLGDDGYFIKGKFDQLSSSARPYQGIASAFSDYCSAVEQRGQDEWDEVVCKVRRDIKGDESELLSKAIPSLRRILIGGPCNEKVTLLQNINVHSCDKSCQQHRIEEEKKQDDIFSESQSRLTYLIKKFITIISNIGDPIVFLLDDMQWASTTDLNVLQSIYQGASNPFMFIFTCRPMELNHPFLLVANDFHNKTDIDLGQLNAQTTNELVAATLKVDNNDCKDLSNFISCASNGNPFYIRQQLISLRESGHLCNDKGTWEWDVDLLEEGISGTVHLLLSKRIKKLPKISQETLKICAYIGTIDLYILGLILRDTNPDTKKSNQVLVKEALSVVTNDGLLALDHNGAITFTHDTVIEAAHHLVESDKRASYHWYLGRVLDDNVCPHLRQRYVFTIAAQFARGLELIKDEVDRIHTATIFLSAGEKSLASGAISEALFFFGKGVSLMHDADWTTNYRLCCDLYTKAADTAALTSSFEEMDSYLKCLYSNCECKARCVDYLNASFIQVRSMAARDNRDSLKVGLNALRRSGENFPSRNLTMHTAVGLARIRSSMKMSKVLSLAPISDRKMIAILRLLHLCVTISISWGQSLLPILCFRVIQINLTYGTSNSMPSAIALYAALLSRFGSLTEADKWANAANALQDKLSSNVDCANVTFFTYGVTFTMSKELQDCLPSLHKGFASGMKFGDTTHAGSCSSAICFILFFTGVPLPKMERTLNKLLNDMTGYNMHRTVKNIQVYKNSIEYCCQGTNKGAICFLTDEGPDDTVSYQARMLELVVCVIFCQYNMAWDLTQNKLKEFFSGTIFPYICAFYRGISAIAFLRRQSSNKKRAMKIAKTCLKKLKRGHNKCHRQDGKCILCHQLQLLEAEWFAIHNKHDQAQELYKLACLNAANTQVYHEYALICERYGEFLLRRGNDEDGLEQLRQSYQSYHKWGSAPKCKLLKEKYPKLIEKNLLAVISI